MKRILIFGDSNTWGEIPKTSEEFIGRYVFEERYGGILQKELGDYFKIIEEGNPGRTTIWDDPFSKGKNGKDYLLPCLDSHQPLDQVVIMLGTNDLKTRFSKTAYEIARSAGVLVEIVQSWKPRVGNSPEILLISPAPLSTLPIFLKDRFQGGIEKSKQFSKEFKKEAIKRKCHFLDLRDIVKPSEVDGVHFDLSAHRTIGEVLAKKIISTLG
jgi:lysophospholipase L1-like esterase